METSLRYLLCVLIPLILEAAGLRAGPPEDADPLPKGVVMTVKTGSLKELSDRILAVARRIEPGPQVEAIPFLLGGMLGDPMLQGVEAGRNMGIAMVRHEGEYVPVLLARLTEESPYRRSLQGFGITLSDYNGWTLGTMAPVEPDALEDYHESLVKWVERPRRHDIAIDFNGPEVSRLIQQMETEIREGIRSAATNGASGLEDAAWAMLRTLAGEFRVASSIGFSLELDPEAIQQRGHIRVEADTALGRFISAEHSVAKAAAEWIEADHPIVYLGRVNPEALRTYLDYFSGKAKAGGGDLVEEIFEALEGMVAPFAEFSDGHTAGFVRFEGMMPKMVQIMDSRYSDDALRASLQALVEMMNRGGWDALSGSALAAATRAELVEAEQTIGEHLVHAVRVRPEERDGDEVSATDREVFGLSYEQVNYYVQVGGFLLMADDFDDLLALTTAIDEGEKPARSAADSFNEETGLAGQWIVNPGPILAAAQVMGATGGEAAADLPAARGELRSENNVLHGTFSIPVEMIAHLYREGKAMAEGMGVQEFDFGDELEVEEPDQ